MQAGGQEFESLYLHRRRLTGRWSAVFFALYPSLVLALLAAVCLSEKNQRHLLPLFVQVTTFVHVTTLDQAPLLTHGGGGGRQGADRQADDGFTCRPGGTGKTFNSLCTTMLSATGFRLRCHQFYMTTCAAATAACGPGAKMNLAYATGPFSVPNCPARPSRTTEGLILYGAVGCAAT